MLAGHLQELALVEVIERRKDGVGGEAKPIETSVINSLRLAPSFGALWYENIDLGFPSIEAVMTPFANRSGSFDETKYHRERAISLDLVILDDWFPEVGAQEWPAEWNSSSYWLRELGKWAVPNKRFRLYWRESGSAEAAYWTDVRSAGMTMPITMADRKLRRVQMNFVCSSGQVYLFNESTLPDRVSKDGRTKRKFPYGGVVSPGIGLPIEFPFAFPGGAPENPEGIEYAGTIDTGFIARIYAGAGGTTVDPRMDVTAPDGSVTTVRFSGLTIPAGQFVQIDTNRMTVLMNGIPSQRRDHLLIPPLRYPQLQPGLNKIRFTTEEEGGAEADSRIETLHYEAFLA